MLRNQLKLLDVAFNSDDNELQMASKAFLNLWTDKDMHSNPIVVHKL